MYIKIYSKDNCPFCDKAVFETMRFRGFLKDSIEPEVNPYPGFDYSIFKLGEDFDMKDLVQLFPTARTFPQIVIENAAGQNESESIGGYDDLVLYLSQMKEQLLTTNETFLKRYKNQ